MVKVCARRNERRAKAIISDNVAECLLYLAVARIVKIEMDNVVFRPSAFRSPVSSSDGLTRFALG